MSPSPIPRFPGLPDRLLEQYLCGELPAAEAARVEAAAKAQPELASYLDTRRSEREAFLQRRPFSLVRGQLEPAPRGLSGLLRWGMRERLSPRLLRWGTAGPLRERLSRWVAAGPLRARLLPWGKAGPLRERLLRQGTAAPPRERLLRWGAVALAPALVVGFLLLLPWRGEDVGVRVRGGVTARLVVKRQEAIFELSPGVVLRPGDRLRIEVDDVEGGHLYVLGLSERGAVTPLQGFESTGGALRLEPGKQVLPGSMELDAAPEREALYLLLAPHPLAEAEVQQWLREATEDTTFPPHPDAPGDSRFSVVELPKEVTP